MSSDPSLQHNTTTSHTTAGASRLRCFAAAVVLAGITAGITGWACAHLLHTVEHFVWSISEGHLVTALETVPWWRRFLTLAAAGVIGAVSWFWVIKKEEIMDEINTGAAKKQGAFWYFTGRYIYVPMALTLCIIALSMHISF